MFSTKDQESQNQGIDIEHVEATLSTLQEQVEQLRKQVALARGTREVVPATQPQTLAQRVERELREHIMSLDQLVHKLEAPAGKVAAVLKEHRPQLHNVGTEDRARWTWKIGDATSTKELRTLVERLIEDQPLTTAELVQATGARAGRVGGAIVEIQRSGANVLDLGIGGKGRWFVVSAKARDARLKPKK